MMKRFYAAFAALFVLSTSVFAAGTLPGISMSQQLGSDGKPLIGGKLYLIQAGTTSTPQNCYQDSGLSIPHPNPITLTSAGRIPQLFCADGSIKVRLTNAAGIEQLVQDNLLVVGPSGGGGGGGSVDPTTVLSTGDMKLVYNTGIYAGFVRANGRTIGSATSGATERANADCQALFVFLWGNDGNLAVSGGRGASAAADWAANKTITLPDFRGRAIAGLDDMGNTAAGRLTSTYFGATATTLGAAGGFESTTLSATQIPPITSSGSNNIVVNAPGGLNFITGTGIATANTQAGPNQVTNVLNPVGNASGAQGTNSISVTSTGTNGNPHRTVPPTMLLTVHIKL